MTPMNDAPARKQQSRVWIAIAGAGAAMCLLCSGFGIGIALLWQADPEKTPQSKAPKTAEPGVMGKWRSDAGATIEFRDHGKGTVGIRIPDEDLRPLKAQKTAADLASWGIEDDIEIHDFEWRVETGDIPVLVLDMAKQPRGMYDIQFIQFAGRTDAHFVRFIQSRGPSRSHFKLEGDTLALTFLHPDQQSNQPRLDPVPPLTLRRAK